MRVGGACGERVSVWGWVEHVGVSECVVCVKCVGVGGASESGWSMWGWVEETGRDGMMYVAGSE